MVCPVRLSGAGIFEVSIEAQTFHAADVAVITVKFIRTARFHGAIRAT